MGASEQKPTFNPGPGWREADLIELGDAHLVLYGEDLVTAARCWIREEPLVPLPTDPGYYLASRPSYGESVVVELLNSPEGQWVDSGDRQYLTDEQVRNMGSLVRLDPRAQTVNAVLDRVLVTGISPEIAEAVRREFGAVS